MRNEPAMISTASSRLTGAILARPACPRQARGLETESEWFPCATAWRSCSPAARAGASSPLIARAQQAGHVLRRALPADRLRALEPREQRLPADPRADPVPRDLADPAPLARLVAGRRCSTPRSTPCPPARTSARSGSAAPPTRSGRTSTCCARCARATSPIFGSDHVYKMDVSLMLDAPPRARRGPDRRHPARAAQRGARLRLPEGRRGRLGGRLPREARRSAGHARQPRR